MNTLSDAVYSLVWAASRSQEMPNDLTSLANVILIDCLWFVVGFALIRIVVLMGFFKRVNLSWLKSSRSCASESAKRRRQALKSLRADAAAGNAAAVITAWDKESSRGETLPLDALRAVVQALASLAPERVVEEVSSHLERYPAAAEHRYAAVAEMIDELVQAGRPEVAEQLVAAACAKLSLEVQASWREALAGGFAAVGDEAKVNKLIAEAEAIAAPMTPRGYALITRGFLQSKKPLVVAGTLLTMSRHGMGIPPQAVTELSRVACRLGHDAVRQTIAAVAGKIPLTVESFGLFLTSCAQREDVDTAHRLEKFMGEQRTQPAYVTYEPMLKLYAKADPEKARQLFRDLQANGFWATEGLCGSLLAKCGDAQSIAFAEDIAEYLKVRSMRTLAIYKTLMKVYANCGCHDKACGLYHEILADGLEPDHKMYGCLMMFAVKCGNTHMSQELFEKTQGGDIQNYMWLIRAAAKDGDVDSALRFLTRLEEEHGASLDVAAYNCTLDACMLNGARDKAEQVLQKIRDKGLTNLVTFNTLIKGHCSQGSIPRARKLIDEIFAAGLRPDGASYNCLLAASVGAGHRDQVWDILHEMEGHNVPLDHYTVSIMMKLAKKAKNPKEADRALAVLDRAHVDVCRDEVLFNTVLDACIQRRDKVRMARIIESFESSQTWPTVHTYGLLIKALGVLQRTTRCRELWRQMVEKRGIKPNDITLSCMLDSLVCAGLIDEAVALFRTWKARVPVNTVMYSTLIKGFANLGDADRAMEVYKEMRAEGHSMNLVCYTSLIDAQARGGNMAQAGEILKQMQADKIEPNWITYTALVKGHCVRGDLEEALTVFQTMVRRGIPADTVVFNTMLDGCVRHAHFELADTMLLEMSKYNLEPSNVTVSILIKMWGKRRSLEDAFKAAHKALREGRPKLDTQVGTCLVSACTYNHNMERALEAFEEIKTWSCCDGPDAGTYGTLIAGLAKHDWVHKALEFALEALNLAAGPRPKIKPLAEECLRQLFDALHQHGLVQEHSLKLEEAMRRAGVPSGLVFSLLAASGGGAAAERTTRPAGRPGARVYPMPAPWNGEGRRDRW